jgi:hypothetical protein
MRYVAVAAKTADLELKRTEVCSHITPYPPLFSGLQRKMEAPRREERFKQSRNASSRGGAPLAHRPSVTQLGHKRWEQ